MLAAALTAWLALAAGPDAARPVVGIGAAAVVTLALSLAIGRRPEPVAAALVLLAAAYVAVLVIDVPTLDSRSAVVGATLLAIGELAHLSLEARATVTGEAGTLARRVGWIAVLSMIALGLGASIIAVVDVLNTGGIAVEVIGVAAAVGIVALLVLAAREALALAERDRVD